MKSINHQGLGESDLDKLVEQICDRIQDGEAVELDVLIEQHPEMADHLKRIYPTLAAMATWKPDRPQASVATDELDSQANRAIGDFRIIRQIGRGGMGIVYLAEQMSVNREVALKVLPLASLIDDKALIRFRNEVRAAATLDHPNIVMVHSVGEDRGIHYYAMQLIRGQSLAAVVHALTTIAKKSGSVHGKSIDGILAESDQENQSENNDVSLAPWLEPTQDDTVAKGRSNTANARFN